MDSMEAISASDAHSEDVRSATYVPVRLDKLLALTFLTFGLYEIVWFYRNWRYVRDVEDEAVIPWGRALFAPLWYFSFAQRLGIAGGVLWATAYLAVTAMWRLPDPWWLVSFLSVFALVPAVVEINRRNEGVASLSPSYGWRKRSGAVATLGVLVLPFSIAGTFGPPTSVVAGQDMRAGHVAFLTSSGIVEEDEVIAFFYSSGFTSIRGEGVVATDQGVTAYWTDPISEELAVAFLPYAEMVDIEVNRSTSWFEDTLVRISNADGDWFSFGLSPEGGGDERFLEALEQQRSAAGGVLISA